MWIVQWQVRGLVRRFVQQHLADVLVCQQPANDFVTPFTGPLVVRSAKCLLGFVKERSRAAETGTVVVFHVGDVLVEEQI